MAPRDGGPPPSPDGPGTRLWSECARAPRKTWVSWGGEHRSTRIPPIRTQGAETRGPREIADFVGWIGVRDPVTLLQRPPKRKAATLPPAGQGAPWLAEPQAL